VLICRINTLKSLLKPPTSATLGRVKKHTSNDGIIHRWLYADLQDQYIEISTEIPASATLYGLGEHTSNDGIDLRRNGTAYALWTRDQPPHLPNVGVYGAHPFYMDVREGAPHLIKS